jgi:(1->4)-alpha-D-glucan 1-alpha-D-glucosylmutase
MAVRIPVSTYRLQFNSGFRFEDARVLVPYLHALGITDVYASPLLQAKRGSPHGYDVTDPSHLNPELGTDQEFDAFVTELHNHDMGLLLDIVPNHMSASSENPWWMDVLENGPRSPFASHFDIDWNPPSRALENRVLLPILGKPYAEVLESGELVLTYEGGSFFIGYFDFKLPVATRSYRQILEHRVDRLQRSLGADAPPFHGFQGVLASLAQLATLSTSSDIAGDRRQREEIKERLLALYNTSPEVRAFVDRNIRTFNGKAGEPASYTLLDRLLSEQSYVLAFWQTANQEINYRRFFAISELVGLRVGDPMAFEASHAVLLRLAEKGLVNGFRVDHIDGLRAPAAYLRKLQDRVASGGNTGKGLPFYIIVEKILSQNEELPSDWPVHGTTGYEFLEAVNELFVDSAGVQILDEDYRKFVGSMPSFEDLVYLKKKQVMTTLLSVEMRSLGRYLAMLAAQDRYAREIAREDLTRVLIETTACLSVYRTYSGGFDLEPADRGWIEKAIAEAQSRNPKLDPASFRFVRQVLLLEPEAHVLPEQREQRLSFVLTWQQMTGPITAKGFEDSVLYIYNRLISLNEVGGAPTSNGREPRELHSFLERRHKTWPFTMNATMTHDAKHAEDFRARLNVLSEIPAEWSEHLERWRSWNADKRTELNSRQVPEPNEEILIYQVLLGSWPMCACSANEYLKRIQEFLMKAGREAMVHTRWTVPNLEHEKAVADFTAAILEPGVGNGFRKELEQLAQKLAFHGALNSLAQLLIKIGSPGVADFYQGSELWDLRLVDPDNRTPVDFASRQRRLAAIDRAPDLSQMLSHWQDATVKLFVTSRALQERRTRDELFLKGSYSPLSVTGAQAESVFAFTRHFRRAWSLIVVPRLTTRLTPGQSLSFNAGQWKDTAVVLPTGTPWLWKNVFTGESHPVSTDHGGSAQLLLRDVLADFPVAMLRDVRRPTQD